MQKAGVKGNSVQINVEIVNDHYSEIREEIFLEAWKTERCLNFGRQ